mmetsp:Transcript_33896/g.74190  ORF Transcript_33896/g.74190 Transcript_33896/m.74190 type:complete len:120 (+) Transcript_33896:87-446(+)
MAHGEESSSERNALHSFAQDIREQGTLGAVYGAVKRNPLLLVPGGSVIMAAQALLARGDETEEDVAMPLDSFDLASALASDPVELQQTELHASVLPTVQGHTREPEPAVVTTDLLGLDS